MQIFVFYKPLMKLIDTRFFIEVLENGIIILAVHVSGQSCSCFDCLTKPGKEVHDLQVRVCLSSFDVKQTFLFKLV